MRKPKRVTGLQGACGVAAETAVGSSVGTSGAAGEVVMPESSKRHLSRGR